MSQPSNPPELVQPRRRDRAITDEGWIKAILHRAPYGVLGTSVENQPFLNTNLFVFDESRHALYFHTAQAGRTRSNIAANPRVCFTVSEMGRLLPAHTALAFSVEYASVVVFGDVTVVEDPAEKRRGLQALLDKYFPHLHPGEDYRPITDEELERTAVYRLDIRQWSGKQKQVEPDFPGAFFYGDPPAA